MAGGWLNTANKTLSFVGGGRWNTARGYASFVGGGAPTQDVEAEGRNLADGDWSVLVGGWNNQATGDYSFVGAGGENKGSGDHSFVGAGGENEAAGEYVQFCPVFWCRTCMYRFLCKRHRRVQCIMTQIPTIRYQNIPFVTAPLFFYFVC